ncbi:MAG TPA: SusC/RagA family TonB-linked outer membrane protein, partial [Rikenellaceae bacterium]|nr:SusC/RagA family TonB-linked outer membrane protein [Rikenellaceae bacterium]
MAILLFLVPSEVFAQKLTISGFVKEAATNEPVPGAVVMIKGTSVGTSTDANGAYTIKADANAVLVCQLFGYKTVEVNVSKRSNVDILLQEDTQMLDATVVVGYGTLKKTQLVGAVENLSGEELEGRTNSNVTRSLQGQIPGLNIVQADGKPTHQGSITIRGNGTSYQSRQKVGGSAKGAKHSIGQGSSALVLIDGVEGDLTTVNPEDIETVAVLKDAASAAVYGARGAFGVILVTTKTPKTDKISVNYNGSVSLNRRNIMWEDELVTDGLQWLDTFVEFFRNDKRTPTSAGSLPGNVNNRSNTYSEAYHEEFRRRKTDPAYENYGKIYGDGKDVGFGNNYAYYGSTNWLDMFYKDMNMTQNHNLSINGASEKVSYAISGRYYGQDGIYKLGNEDFNQFNLRAKGSIKITDWLKLTNNTSVFKRKYHQPMVSGGSQPLLRQFEHRGQPIYPAFNEDGTLTFYGASCMYGAFEDGNTYQENNKLDVITSTTLDFEPIKNVLKFTGDFTYKAIRSTQARVSCIQSGYSAPGALENYNSSSYKSDWRFNTDYISSNIVGTYTPKLGDNHDLNIVAGWNLEKTNYRRLYLTRKDLLYPSIPSFELMASDEYGVEDRGHDKSMVGFFGRVNYTLLNRYIVEVAARYDGSSLFPSYSQWGFFPSASVGWRLSEEPWMEWSKSWMNNFKLRANVGSLGNATIDPYSFLELMGVSKSSKLINGEKVPYTTAASIIPDNLTWETVTTYDAGLDADFLKSRLSISADYYVRDVKDMFIQGPDLPEVLGDSTPKGNYGAIQTKGWEATIGWRDSFKLAGKDFNYNIKASVWDSRTWVKTYYNINGDILNYYEGKELGEIWGFRTDGYFLSNEEANNWATDKFHKNG